MKLPLDVLRAVRAEVGAEFPVWIKLDSREVGKSGGITLEDGIGAAKLAEAAGADAITATTYHETCKGALHSESHTPNVSDFNLAATSAMRAAVRIPVLGSGRVEPDSADRAIGKGHLDFVAMGRKLLADPDLPNKLVARHPDAVRPCIYCYTCISAIYMGGAVKCAVNPELANEAQGGLARTAQPKTIAVIGGGPGGMESARRLAALGHRPVLIERSERLGGTLRFASLAYPANERLLDWLQSELAEAKVEVRLSTEATPELLRRLGADEIVVATGAVRSMPDIPGNDQNHVFSGEDMRQMIMGERSDSLKKKTSLFTRLATKVGSATGASANLELVRKATRAWMPIGDNVAIIGGELVGLELAEFLCERGRKVAVIEAAPRLGKGLQLVRRMRILSELAEHGVGLHGGAQDLSIGASDVHFTNAKGEACGVPADTVIVAQGAEGDLSLAKALIAAGFKVHAIGDAGGVGYINEAMRGAAEAVRAIAAGD